MSPRDPHAVLRAYLTRHGLKASRQREIVADAFFHAGGHQRIDDLLDLARRRDPKISPATVYRTMKLLTDCGLAAARNFMDGHTRYERSDDREHHDHLICTGCAKIVEFVNTQIEALQDSVAAAHGFVVAHHKMELYGLCGACRARAAVRGP